MSGASISTCGRIARLGEPPRKEQLGSRRHSRQSTSRDSIPTTSTSVILRRSFYHSCRLSQFLTADPTTKALADSQGQPRFGSECGTAHSAIVGPILHLRY